MKRYLAWMIIGILAGFIFDARIFLLIIFLGSCSYGIFIELGTANKENVYKVIMPMIGFSIALFLQKEFIFSILYFLILATIGFISNLVGIWIGEKITHPKSFSH